MLHFVRLSLWYRWVLCAFFLSCNGIQAFAKKGNRPIYDDNFDLAGGGANLTKASQLGTLTANPALLPYGPSFHRWAGLELGLQTSPDSIDFAKGMTGGGGGSSNELVEAAFSRPIHFGYSLALGYMNRMFGLAVFSRAEPDIRARRFGDSGMPQIEFNAESYHAAAISLANTTITRNLSLGITGKYIYAAEPSVNIEVTDQQALSSLTSAESMKSQFHHNTGFGTDVGALLFIQGSWLDYRLTTKIDDVGGTTLKGKGTLNTLEQVVSVGTSLTLHTDTDALHLALDYRDVLNAYDEQLFKKVYTGIKLTLRTYIGFAAGLYHGYPSFGTEIDLIILRISGSVYTKEMGKNPGVDPRKIYLVTLSLGY